MVTLNHLSVKDQDDVSLMLPEAADSSVITTPVLHRQRELTKTVSRRFFLSRGENLAFSFVLLIGCYSSILIPAYFPVDEVGTLSSDVQHLEDLVLLNRSAALLSVKCQPHWCLNHLKSLSSEVSAGLVDIPVFVQQDRPVSRDPSQDLSPPLGLRGSEEHLALALDALPEHSLPYTVGSCRRCMVVGNGGVLHGSHLGSHIDQYDIIIRLNNAPVIGFERDAGSRTTVRLLYPEGAPHSEEDYKKTATVALVVFKNLDLDWLTSVVTKKPLSFWSKLWFWREVVDEIPLRPESFRILHPEIVRKTGEVLQRYVLNGKSNLVPTLGASAVVMALQLCDHVSLAGFGYDLQRPESRLHYYENIRMDAMKAQVVHDVGAERLFLKDLVAAGAVSDLTGALRR